MELPATQSLTNDRVPVSAVLVGLVNRMDGLLSEAQQLDHHSAGLVRDMQHQLRDFANLRGQYSQLDRQQ